jgi:hypothetical protein
VFGRIEGDLLHRLPRKLERLKKQLDGKEIVESPLLEQRLLLLMDQQ